MTRAKKSSVLKNQKEINIEELIHSSSKDVNLIKAKQLNIARCAKRVFIKKGYHPTTTREIAQACNISIGQLYHYISSKDDVLYLVTKFTGEFLYEHLRKSGVHEIKDPLQRLIKCLYNTMEFMYEEKKLFQFIFSETKHLDKKHLRVILEMDDKYQVGFWRELLDEVKRQKLIKGDQDILANLITFILYFLPLRGWNLRHKQTKKIFGFLVEFISRGIGAIQ